LHRLAVPKADEHSERAEKKTGVYGYMQRNHKHFFSPQPKMTLCNSGISGVMNQHLPMTAMVLKE